MGALRTVAAWISPVRSFINHAVLPNATVFTILLILFQVTVAALMLTRGDLATSALVAGAAFAALAAFASISGGAAGSRALAVIQTSLAIS